MAKVRNRRYCAICGAGLPFLRAMMRGQPDDWCFNCTTLSWKQLMIWQAPMGGGIVEEVPTLFETEPDLETS